MLKTRPLVKEVWTVKDLHAAWSCSSTMQDVICDICLRDMHICIFHTQGIPNKCPDRKNSKLNTIGPNFTKYITWEVLFRLSLLVRNYQKLISRHKGFRLLVIESVHCFLGGTPWQGDPVCPWTFELQADAAGNSITSVVAFSLHGKTRRIFEWAPM